MTAREKQQLILASITTTGLFGLVLFLLSNFSPLRSLTRETELGQVLEQLTEASASGEASDSSVAVPFDLDLSDIASPQ